MLNEDEAAILFNTVAFLPNNQRIKDKKGILHINSLLEFEHTLKLYLKELMYVKCTKVLYCYAMFWDPYSLFIWEYKKNSFLLLLKTRNTFYIAFVIFDTVFFANELY